jgi:hypothetical protein
MAGFLKEGQYFLYLPRRRRWSLLLPECHEAVLPVGATTQTMVRLFSRSPGPRSPAKRYPSFLAGRRYLTVHASRVLVRYLSADLAQEANHCHASVEKEMGCDAHLPGCRLPSRIADIPTSSRLSPASGPHRAEFPRLRLRLIPWSSDRSRRPIRTHAKPEGRQSARRERSCPSLNLTLQSTDA